MNVTLAAGQLSFHAGPFSLGPGRPALHLDGQACPLRARPAPADHLVWAGDAVELRQHLRRESRRRVRITSTLHHIGGAPVMLNAVVLWRTRRLRLGPAGAEVRILEQDAYHGRVCTPRQMFTGRDGLRALDGTTGGFVSHNLTVFHCPAHGSALLLGWETIDRWLPHLTGRMQLAEDAGEVARDGMANVDGAVTPPPPPTGPAADRTARVPPFTEFALGFDGGDYPLQPGETLALGEFVVESGSDPLALLDAHGRRLKRRNRLPDPPAPLANWCSWYPYRLGVTQELVGATARAARARHLDRLGLRFLQVDLGWQEGNLPTSFEPNARFAAGLHALSGALRREGFELGLWVGVLCIAADHPVAREHPAWLLRGPDGRPRENYRWFWEPFCPVYALDVSHPGARAWLRDNFARLAVQGVRFIKWDFAGVVTGRELRGRHDSHLVNTRAREAVRTAFRIAQDALDAAGPGGFMIDCSATDYAGAGIAALNYANMDTGNTGLGWAHLREVYTSYACHLFKHHWALLQPSCLVVGLPGTLEEARVRATITFMGAGHVDLGDDLTSLPEDRWQVLLSTLPPNDTPATPVDLFEPIKTGVLSYVGLIKAKENPDPGASPAALAAAELAAALPPPTAGDPAGAGVWSLPVTTDWDSWYLVAVVNWTEAPVEPASGVRLARRFQIEFARLGLDPRATYWGYEFWSGQFIGPVPRPIRPAGSYRHPGDFTSLILESGPGLLDLGFHGPAVKLLVLRRPRPHPWPLGTSFHQSGGRELRDVRWDARTRTLSGQLHRPPGESGHLLIAVPSGNTVTPHRVPLVTTGESTPWAVQF
jgi:hypothetical protein